MLTNSTITILKQVRKGRDDIYIPLTPTKAHWEETKGYNLLQSSRALNEIDNITVYIPIIAEKIKAEDLIVKAEVSKEYLSYEELKKDYDDAFIITTVDKYDYGSLQHIEIGAK